MEGITRTPAACALPAEEEAGPFTQGDALMARKASRRSSGGSAAASVDPTGATVRLVRGGDGTAELYVAGALAELELGPSARNIAGARLAAERIVEGALLKGRV